MAKYGRCPTCLVGRRIRSRYNPKGKSPHKGKFRFTCSNRKGAGGGGDDDDDDEEEAKCDYDEVLDSDPAEDPKAYQDEVLGQGRLLFKADRSLGIQKAADAAKAGLKLGGERPLGKDKPQQKLGCPECEVGVLVTKCKDTFHWKETYVVCVKAWDPKTKEWVGGCGYTLDIDREEDDGEDTDGDGAALVKAAAATKAGKKKGAAEAAREMEEMAAADQERLWDNPEAAAVMAGAVDRFKKKVVVDLTDDDEVPGLSSSSTAPASTAPGSSMVGPYAPIVIEDDESEPAKSAKSTESVKPAGSVQFANYGKLANHVKPANYGKLTESVKPTKAVKPAGSTKPADLAEFDDFGSEDERELMKLADWAAKDDLDEQDELELIQLADQFSSPATRPSH